MYPLSFSLFLSIYLSLLAVSNEADMKPEANSLVAKFNVR